MQWAMLERWALFGSSSAVQRLNEGGDLSRERLPSPSTCDDGCLVPLAGLEPAACCLGDNCQSSGLYGPVGSRQLRLGRHSAESGLVRFSCGVWNDCENDHLSKRWPGSGASELRPRPVIIPITEPRSRCANRELCGQADPLLPTTSGWHPTASQPRTAEVAATLFWDTASGHR